MLRKNLTQEFNSIFEGTDRNISSIKRNLTSVEERKQFMASRSSPPKNNSLNFVSSPRHTGSSHSVPFGSPNTSQTPLITSMFNRLEEQSKTISLLEAMVHTQTDEIRKIKTAQQELRSSALQSHTGNDVEVRLENTEKELRLEIEGLRHIIKRSEQTNGYHNEGICDIDKERERIQLSEDIKSQRRLIEKETDSLRREVDGLKSRVGKVEFDVTSSLKDSAEVGRKFARIENDVVNIINNQTNLTNANEGGERQLRNIKNELEEITSLMRKSRIEGTTERKYNYENSHMNLEKRGSKKVSSVDRSPMMAHGKRRSSKKALSVDSSPTMSLPSPISDGASFNSYDFSEVDALSSLSKEISNSKNLLLTTIDDDDGADDLMNDDVDDILQFDSDVDLSPALKTKVSKGKTKKHISFLSDEDGEEDHILGFDSDTDPASRVFDDDKLSVHSTKHVSILDDDDEDVIAGFSAANDDDELFLEKEPDTLTLDKLSGDEHISLGNFSDNSL